MKEALIHALKALDTGNDDHWTADGLPKIEALGLEGIKRKDVTEVAPQFNRAHPVIDVPADVAEKKAEAAAKEVTFEDALAAAKAKIERTGAALQAAVKVHDAALREHDVLAQEAYRRDTQRLSNQGVLDYLAAKRKAREEAETK